MGSFSDTYFDQVAFGPNCDSLTFSDTSFQDCSFNRTTFGGNETAALSLVKASFKGSIFLTPGIFTSERVEVQSTSFETSSGDLHFFIEGGVGGFLNLKIFDFSSIGLMINASSSNRGVTMVGLEVEDGAQLSFLDIEAIVGSDNSCSSERDCASVRVSNLTNNGKPMDVSITVEGEATRPYSSGVILENNEFGLGSLSVNIADGSSWRVSGSSDLWGVKMTNCELPNEVTVKMNAELFSKAANFDVAGYVGGSNEISWDNSEFVIEIKGDVSGVS